jgi:hypothetical protein
MTTMTRTDTGAHRADDGTWRVARWLVGTQVTALGVLWVLAAAVTVGVSVLVAWRAGSTFSTWQIALMVGRWWALAVGAYTAFVHLPLFLVHGHTRRSCARQLAAFVLAFAVAFTVLGAAGFAVELAVFRLAGIDTAALHADLSLFDAGIAAAVGRLLFASLLWTLAGGVGALGVYRSDLRGTAGLLVAIVAVITGELVAQTGIFDVLDDLSLFPSLLLPVVGVSLVGVVGAVGWALLRDLALRPR